MNGFGTRTLGGLMVGLNSILQSKRFRIFSGFVMVSLVCLVAYGAGSPNTNVLLQPSANPAAVTVGVPFTFQCEAYPPTGRTLVRMDYYYWRDGAQVKLGAVNGAGPIFTLSATIPAVPANGTNDSIYCIAVTDWNQSIGLLSSRPVTVSAGTTADTQAPTVPNGLTATPSTTSASLTWSAATDNFGVTGYEVSINGGAAIATTVTGYTATNLTSNTGYNFKVRARDAAGNWSAYSSAVNFTTTAATGGTPNTNTLILPSANPALITVGVPFTFQCNAYAPTGRTLVRMDYYYYRDGAQVSIGSVSGAGPNFTLSTATIPALPSNGTNDSIYCVAITDWNQSIGIGGGRSVVVSAPSDVTAPSVPTGLASSGLTYNSVTLNWNASSDNVAVSRYEIQTNSTGTPVSVSAPTVSRSMTGLTASTAYQFRVRACDAASNCSAYSSNISVTTPAAPVDTTAPSVPSGLSASPASTSASLSWTASTDNLAVTGYEVSINGGAAIATSSNLYSASGLTPNTGYNFKVRARDAAGNWSTYSAVSNFSTTSAVSSVNFSYGSAHSIQLSATVQSSPASITLSWPTVTGASNNSSFSIYRKLLGASSWGTAIATVASNASSYTDSAVTVGTAYEYRVNVSRAVGTAYGYILSGVNVEIDGYKGRILLLVDSSLQSLIQTQLDTLSNDLYGEGWIPLTQNVSRTASPSTVRSSIQSLRTTYPDLNAVYLIGHIPVAYAGNNNPDGHASRSMGSDGYYAELTSTWNSSSGCANSRRRC